MTKALKHMIPDMPVTIFTGHSRYEFNLGKDYEIINRIPDLGEEDGREERIKLGRYYLKKYPSKYLGYACEGKTETIIFVLLRATEEEKEEARANNNVQSLMYLADIECW